MRPRTELLQQVDKLAAGQLGSDPFAGRLIAEARNALAAGGEHAALAFEIDLLADVLTRASADERNVLLEMSRALKERPRVQSIARRPLPRH